jgi:nicotinamidase-related amidase
MSGCVQATVVDALQYGFRPVVPREAVGGNLDAHEANLYGVDAKYGEQSQETSRLRSIPSCVQVRSRVVS